MWVRLIQGEINILWTFRFHFLGVRSFRHKGTERTTLQPDAFSHLDMSTVIHLVKMLSAFLSTHVLLALQDTDVRVVKPCWVVLLYLRVHPLTSQVQFTVLSHFSVERRFGIYPQSQLRILLILAIICFSITTCFGPYGPSSGEHNYHFIHSFIHSFIVPSRNPYT
jgi:hypothetical protein